MTEAREGGGELVRVLLVEDDPRIAAFMTKGLRASAFDVTWVETGEAGLAEIEAGRHDVVLLDLGLPDIDGLELLRLTRARGESIPTIVVTARTDANDRAEALALGVRAYLTKPFPWKSLLAEVRACVPVAEQP